MTPELIRLFIICMLVPTLLWAIAALIMMLRFGAPSRVPTPPLPPRRRA